MYKLNQFGVTRLADGASIPFADGNMDFEEFKKWKAKGNVPAPVDVPLFADEAKTHMDDVRVTRERILNRLAGFAAAALATGDTATATAFVSVRQKLLDLPKAPAVTGATNLVDLKLAILTTLKSIEAGAPLTLRAAFTTLV